MIKKKDRRRVIGAGWGIDGETTAGDDELTEQKSRGKKHAGDEFQQKKSMAPGF
ncbi:hypothetical protein [Desulfopila inferna]|uniref:hypothetical protein n=1 Tax=Desulfopila inferna TaxID=468528 RepID=UPI0019658E1B|nr:hypothetical protein [Desulfopila inferna]MBM9603839.1 hypothetical protein [Desulfopila inferna]